MNPGRIGWMAAAALWLVGTGAWAQQPRPPAPPQAPRAERADREDRGERRLTFERQRAELEFANEMRELQLEQKRLELDRARRALEAPPPAPGPCKPGWDGPRCRMMHRAGFLLLCLVVHLLLATWVVGDLRRRNAGSGLWIPVTLLTGLFGALVYAVVRLGDKPAA